MKTVITKVLWTLALLSAAYGCGPDAPPAPPATAVPIPTLLSSSQSTPAPTPTPAPTAMPAAIPTTTPTPTLPQSTPAPVATPSATPPPNAVQWLPDLFYGGTVGGAASGGEEGAASVEDVLEQGLRLAGASPVHLSFRGTAAYYTTRCEWRGIARAPDQREAAIRFWLDLDDSDPLPAPAEVERRFTAELDRIGAVYPATVKSNFISIATGGLTTGYTFLTCYAEYTIQEYVLGSGSTGASNKLTVAYDRMGESRSYELYKLAHAEGEFGSESLMTEAEYAEWRSQLASDVELVLAAILEGRESVVFLAPMGAHNAIAVEAWQAIAQWDVQTAAGGTVNAVRYGASPYDPEHTQTLANLKSRIATATATTSTATPTAGTPTATPTPTRIANVSGLTQYYRDIGAYGDITPDDGDATTFTPAQPPPVYAPAPSSLTATGSGEDTANLTWAAVSDISNYHVQHREDDETRWTTATDSATGTTHSVARLWCGKTHEFRVGARGDGTTYNSRAGLWSPTATAAMDACTPHPSRFRADSYTFEVAVGGSSGDPVGVVSAIDVNDDAITYSITAGNEAGKFAIDATTGAITLAASLSPTAGVAYTLTVGASDDVSGTGSATVTVTTACPDTGACNRPPEFSSSVYDFTVAEDASTGDAVGTVSATDPDTTDTLTYSITAGNADGMFAIVGSSGVISVAGELDYETTLSYTLTAQASDGIEDGSDTVTVEIAVTDVAEDPPPAPEGLASGASGLNTVSLSWTAVRGAASYRVEWRTGSGEWTVASDSIVGSVFTAHDLEPGTEYAFQVSAYGDGVAYRAVFGEPSAALLVSTLTPPEAPTITSLVAGSSSNQLVVTWEWNGDSCFVTGRSSGYEVIYKKATVASWRDPSEVTAQAPNDSDSGAYEVFVDYGRKTISETFTIGASASGSKSHGQIGVALDAVAYDVRVAVYSGVCNVLSPDSEVRRGTPTR